MSDMPKVVFGLKVCEQVLFFTREVFEANYNGCEVTAYVSVEALEKEIKKMKRRNKGYMEINGEYNLVLSLLREMAGGE